MNMETAFKILSALAALGWIILIVRPGWNFGREKIVKGLVPVLLASAYAALFPVQYLKGLPGGFSSLAEVKELLVASDGVLLAAWIHYLVFDLLIGTWIVEDAKKRSISHVMILPSLACTFMFGPAGWLSYRVLRRLKKISLDRQT